MFNLTKKLLTAAGILWFSGMLPAQAGSLPLLFSTLGGAIHLTAAISKTSLENQYDLPIERQCLTFALYHEARGEPEAGQMAVGATILNRVRSRSYPNSICGVVYQNAARKNACQFSFACDDMDDVPGNQASLERMSKTGDRLIGKFLKLKTEEISGPHVGAIEYTHYHRHDVSPSWSRQLHRLGKIGNHVFFRSERVVRRYNESL